MEEVEFRGAVEALLTFAESGAGEEGAAGEQEVGAERAGGGGENEAGEPLFAG